jgi:predicted dienelactone hydrolase
MFMVILALLLSLASPLAAQEEGGPPQVGLRPDAPTYALHGPFWVGVTQLEAETPYHPTKIMVWYPALNPEGAEETTTYNYDYDPDSGVMPIAGHALDDAAPDSSGGPYPLVIFVHGWQGERHEGNWLGEHLASYGFIVMSMDQIENAGTEGIFERSLFRRPQEVTWLIDYTDALTNSGNKFRNLIDMDRIAVTGHSFGGYTALMAGGAQMDWQYFDAWCSENYERAVDRNGDNFCEFVSLTRWSLAPLADLLATRVGLWPSWGDPRVDAIVPMAPPFGMLFGPEGLGNIRIPFLLLAGSADTSVVPPDWSDLFYEDVGSTQKGLVVF